VRPVADGKDATFNFYHSATRAVPLNARQAYDRQTQRKPVFQLESSEGETRKGNLSIGSRQLHGSDSLFAKSFKRCLN
jgi:hypothetical protein